MTKSRPSLTEGAVFKTLLVFSLPILGSNVLQSLNGSVNSIWVGRYLGGAALTATANANAILFFLISMLFGVGMAASILVGQAFGARDIDQAKRVVGTSASFFVVVSIAVAVLGFLFARQFLVWMRTPAEALPDAVAYLRTVFVAVPFIFAYAFVVMILRGAGDARTPLAFSALCVALDIAFNPIFIFGVGPLPKLGVAGSGVASVVANGLTLIAIVVYLYRQKNPLCLRGVELAYLRGDRLILATLVKKGLPMGLSMIVMSSSAIVMVALVNGYGTDTAAAFGASLQIWNYIQLPSFAVGMAASAVAAQNVGAGRWDRVEQVARAGVIINLLMTGTLATLIVVFARSALGLFLTDPAAIEAGIHLNAIAVWSFGLFGISMVLSGVVRSTGAVLMPLAILFVSLWVLRIPFAVALLASWGADAIWWSFPLGSLASAVLSGIYYRYGSWRSARMLTPRVAASPP
jgi:putative MATE family efflux protein